MLCSQEQGLPDVLPLTFMPPYEAVKGAGREGANGLPRNHPNLSEFKSIRSQPLIENSLRTVTNQLQFLLVN